MVSLAMAETSLNARRNCGLQRLEVGQSCWPGSAIRLPTSTENISPRADYLNESLKSKSNCRRFASAIGDHGHFERSLGITGPEAESAGAAGATFIIELPTSTGLTSKRPNNTRWWYTTLPARTARIEDRGRTKIELRAARSVRERCDKPRRSPVHLLGTTVVPWVPRWPDFPCCMMVKANRAEDRFGGHQMTRPILSLDALPGRRSVFPRNHAVRAGVADHRSARNSLCEDTIAETGRGTSVSCSIGIPGGPTNSCVERFELGLDNWIYCANGAHHGKPTAPIANCGCGQKTDKTIVLGKSAKFRFRPTAARSKPRIPGPPAGGAPAACSTQRNVAPGQAQWSAT